ncbi:MAG: chemotaxis protein CheD [Chthoniobacteraceae bacterium]
MSNSGIHAPASPWVITPPKKNLVVGVGDMLASNDPAAQIVTYSLGSCLGVAIFDPVKKVGGLLHLMLPDSTINPGRAAMKPHMFVDTGVPSLFRAVYELGGEKSRVILKVAGGAQFLDEKRVFNIGDRNFQALEIILARNGVRIAAADTGGRVSRTVRLDLSTGQFSVQVPGKEVILL